MNSASPTDGAGYALAGWATREALLRREVHSEVALHVQLSAAPFVLAVPDGEEVVYHAPEALA